jgi:hypothetical protein
VDRRNGGETLNNLISFTVAILKLPELLVNCNHRYFFTFQARRRWKHSMKVVFLCNKLSRNRLKSLSGEGIAETGRDSPIVSMAAGKVMAVS